MTGIQTSRLNEKSSQTPNSFQWVFEFEPSVEYLPAVDNG